MLKTFNSALFDEKNEILSNSNKFTISNNKLNLEKEGFVHDTTMQSYL